MDTRKEGASYKVYTIEKGIFSNCRHIEKGRVPYKWTLVKGYKSLTMDKTRRYAIHESGHCQMRENGVHPIYKK